MFALFGMVDRGIKKTTEFVLIVAICLIFMFSMVGIVARWFQMAFLWIDPLVRHLVFLSGFLAGILITGESKHLAIDLMGRYLEHRPRAATLLKRVITLATGTILLWLVKSGYDAYRAEVIGGSAEFLEIHTSVWMAIIPAGFALMSYRAFYLFLSTFKEGQQ
jgi:TRAP-type C4-dicarboxylate transport system permease small subunit